jgi:hypothetical protein
MSLPRIHHEPGCPRSPVLGPGIPRTRAPSNPGHHEPGCPRSPVLGPGIPRTRAPSNPGHHEPGCPRSPVLGPGIPRTRVSSIPGTPRTRVPQVPGFCDLGYDEPECLQSRVHHEPGCPRSPVLGPGIRRTRVSSIPGTPRTRVPHPRDFFLSRGWEPRTPPHRPTQKSCQPLNMWKTTLSPTIHSLEDVEK